MAVAAKTLTIAEAAGLRGKESPSEASLQECINAATAERERVGMALACFEGFLGFEAVLPPEHTKVIWATPQIAFRGRALAVSKGHDGLFIADIRVGKNSQFITETPLPVASLVPGAADPEWLLGVGCESVCRVGQAMSLSVENRTTEQVAFSAIYFGDLPEAPEPRWH